MRDSVLVTGATGFVGSHLAQLLIQKDFRVRVLVRPQSPLTNIKNLNVEIVHGDLRDSNSLQKAVSGVRYVFHAAADYRLWVPDPKTMEDINVNGTRQLLEEARKAGVERIIYTSTVATIGRPTHGLVANEDNRAQIKDVVGPYKKSKLMAEEMVEGMAQQGVPVVIVNPTAPIGAQDVKPTPTGKIIVNFLKRQLPAYLKTGLNFVDVEDVAQGHWLALEKGKVGRRYILGCENMTLKEFLNCLGEITGLKAPRIRMPYAVAYGAALVDSGISTLLRKPPTIPIDGVRMAKRFMFFSSDRAQKELGYKPRGIENAIIKATRWFKEHGMAA